MGLHVCYLFLPVCVCLLVWTRMLEHNWRWCAGWICLGIVCSNVDAHISVLKCVMTLKAKHVVGLVISHISRCSMQSHTFHAAGCLGRSDTAYVVVYACICTIRKHDVVGIDIPCVYYPGYLLHVINHPQVGFSMQQHATSTTTHQQAAQHSSYGGLPELNRGNACVTSLFLALQTLFLALQQHLLIHDVYDACMRDVNIFINMAMESPAACNVSTCTDPFQQHAHHHNYYN
jgi:hypothetical protein